MAVPERIASWFARLSAAEMALILAVVAQTLFVLNLGQPAKLMFDESHYVPAARDLFAMAGPSNIEHPPFGKWLIGLSMALFGDTPAGWRVLSTVAGTATILAIYAIALALFRDIRTAATAAILTLLNQMVFIQARIAMLDIFMGAFLLAALALVIHARRGGRPARPMLIAAGVCLGLSVASKWAAIPYVAVICAGFLWVRWRGDSGAWPGVSITGGLACLGLVSLATYFVTFAPMFFYAHDPLTLAQLIPHQFRMLALQSQPLAPHTYMSDWWDWPLITRPIWYLYEPIDGVTRGVLLVGNPAIMWGGLVAVAACLWAGMRDKATPLLLVAGLYLFALGVWIVIPKQIGFYYYYYLPALFLSLALAGAFQHWRMRRVPAIFLTICVALFVYFFPILSAAALPNDQAFLHWMWFSTWP